MVIPRTEVTVRRGDAVLIQRTVPPGEYTIGGTGADFVLEDAAAVLHARLTINYHELFIEDLSGTGGLLVGGQKIAGCQRLFPTQKVWLGESTRLETRRLKTAGAPGDSLAPVTATLQQLLPAEWRGEQKYEIGRLIAEGGMGAILEARERTVGRTVAMKVMLCAPTDTHLARFIEEAQVTGQLEHPNIVPVHELGVDECEQLFYTMKYVRGVTLKEVLAGLRSGDRETVRQYPLAGLLTVFQKICDAVAFAHSRRVIHRDLKPENIMLGSYGEVLVMDWGLTKVFPADRPASEPAAGNLRSTVISVRGGGGTSATLAGTLVGTPHFMSPEQARGEAGSLDLRTDIYALGAILYYLLHLQPPVAGETVTEVLDNVRAGRVALPPASPARSARSKESAPALPHLPGGRVPESLTAVALKALSFARADRYASVRELQAEITAFQGGFATAAEHATAFKQLSLAIGRYKNEAVLLAASLLLLLAVGVLAFLKVAHERNVATGERSRAEKALTDLRGTAPAFAAQARGLAAQERFGEALQKLDYALQLSPQTVEYLLAQADLLACQARLPEAAAAYRAAEQAGDRHGRAPRDAALCDRLATMTGPDGRLTRDALAELLDAMLLEKRPAAELMPVARLLGQERQMALAYWRERLRDLPIPPDRPLESRLTARPDGLLSLDLSGTAIADLRPLTGMPLADLQLRACPEIRTLETLRELPLRSLQLEATGVTDLTPLHGMKLENLTLKDTRITDLAPLAGLPLKVLDCTHLPVIDCAGLAGLPLETLLLAGTRVRDLSFVRGMPLKMLDLDGCREVRQLRALATLGSLEVLILPQNFYEFPAADLASIAALRQHPALRQLTASPMAGMRPGSAESKDAFWAEWEPSIRWLERLAQTGVHAGLLRLPDGTWEVELRDQPLPDLDCLREARLSKLTLFNVPIHDLRPLRGMPLRFLDLRQTAVTDLSPLHGMPLRSLLLWRTKVADFSVLSSLLELEMLDVSETPLADLRLIASRHLRNLRMGSTRVTDLAPLAGLPLEKIHFDSVEISDLRPLLQCPALRWIVLPKNARNVTLLKDLPNLQRISCDWREDSEPAQSADEFWRQLAKPPPPR